MRFRRHSSLSVLPSGPTPNLLSEAKKADVDRSGFVLDLDIALDVTVRAAVQYTGGNGAAVAVLDQGNLVCRARLGAMAPEVGVVLNIASGITGACVRTAQVLQCDDTEKDERVDAEVCRSMGIRSIVVIPILVGGTVTGLLEVLSDRPQAFTAAHVHWLQKAAGLICNLGGRQANLATNVAADVRPTVESGPRDLAVLASTPEITKKASPEPAGVAAFRDVLDKTVQTSKWEDIRQQLVSQLQK